MESASAANTLGATPGHTTKACPIDMHATIFMHSNQVDLFRRRPILQPAHTQAVHSSSTGGLQWPVQAVGPWRRPTACCHPAQLLRDVPQPHLPYSHPAGCYTTAIAFEFPGSAAPTLTGGGTHKLGELTREYLAILQAHCGIAPISLQAPQRRAAGGVRQTGARLAHVQQAQHAVRGRRQRVEAVWRYGQAAQVVL